MAKRTRAILRFVPRPKERGPSSLTALDIALQKQRVTDYELDTTNQDDMKLTVFGDTGLPLNEAVAALKEAGFLHLGTLSVT